MKIKANLIITVLAGVAFTFSACKKSSNSKPATTTLTPKEVSSQVALNITQTLSTSFGSFNLSDGWGSLSTLGLVKNQNGLQVNSNGNELCGTTSETPLDYSEDSGGTSVKMSGNMKFAFTCTNGVLSGYGFVDDLTIAESTSTFSLNYKINENMTITAVTPSSKTTSIVLAGTIGYGGTYNYSSGSNKGSATQNFAYTYHAVTIDSNGVIASGSADFNTSGSGTTGTWNYSGTITFLGNGSAKIIINNATYTVNLLTGEVSG
ncbi:hypothetical protein FO440_01435 [Mucilaginibacter corticis]|uniref:Uncharacterized protein n=1 Tax=Mucilaginibacter corticis TaxID=2597670 RepID=A0A556MSM2_9SPHI|nr:hypothetical protein [Mucilaginibacter corticis]TSJ42877.1 hypothetical protein FO440_01435 [Mucilaginibacter corticis]